MARRPCGTVTPGEVCCVTTPVGLARLSGKFDVAQFFVDVPSDDGSSADEPPPPPRRRRATVGQGDDPPSPSAIQSLKYPDEARDLWVRYVPPAGQADTVQGELMRAVEKLRDEAQRNGNQNWDSGHVILAEYLRDTLTMSGLFDAMAAGEIRGDVGRLLDYEYPQTADEPFDRLTDRIVEWALAHPQPVPHPPNPLLKR